MKANWQTSRTQRIDLGLAVVASLTPPGYCWTQTDLAAVCGCTQGGIYAIEQKALRKLRRAAARKGLTP